MKNIFNLFYRVNPFIFKSNLFFLFLAGVSLVGIVIDPRTVSGINPWIKPLKFEISIIIFLFTMAWVMQYFSKEQQKKYSWYFFLFMVYEIICINFQALRGVRSHFNIDGLLDQFIYSSMGIAIVLNTILVGKVAWLLIKTPPDLPRPYLLSIQLGIISLIVGSLVGGLMSGLNAHSIGVSDGGPGLPFLNWSTLAGDLRVAHFIGLHGVQLMIFLGYVLTYFSWIKFSEKNSIRIIGTVFTLFMIFFVFVLAQALCGKPFLSV